MEIGQIGLMTLNVFSMEMIVSGCNKYPETAPTLSLLMGEIIVY